MEYICKLLTVLLRIHSTSYISEEIRHCLAFLKDKSRPAVKDADYRE